MVVNVITPIPTVHESGSAFFADYAYDKETRRRHEQITCEAKQKVKNFFKRAAREAAIQGVIFVATEGLGQLAEAADLLLAARAAKEAEVLAVDAAQEGRLVIGRGKDLATPGALNPGEYKLRWPPSGTVKSDWKINSGFLRQELGKGNPIRDASIGDTGGMYLNAERNLLRDRGWSFDASTGYWNPPTH